MTLLDAPKFDTARDRRRRIIIYVTVGVLGVFIGGFWLAAGMPFDWPWTWNNHSAPRFKRSRDVARIFTRGALARILASKCAPASKCSKLSITKSNSRSRSCALSWV